MALTVKQAEARVALLQGSPFAAEAQAALAQFRATGNADVFTSTVEGLGSQFKGDEARRWNATIARFDTVAPRFTADQAQLESSLMQAVNLESDRGAKVTGITPSLTPFVVG